MRYFMPTVNMRNFSSRTGLGLVHAGPARSYAAARHRRMKGLGAAAVNPSGTNFSLLPRTNVQACPAWGCGAPRLTIVQPIPTTPTNPIVNSGSGSTGGSTAQQVAGTPVPIGFNLNSVYIASNGSQWEYSSTAGTWINVGTPYNLNTTTGTTTTNPTTAAGYASTAQQVYGTPVPVGYPTNSAYTDVYGNTWQFNSQYGTWMVTTTAAQSAAALAAGSTAASSVPAGTPTNAPYTDANGNTWTYDASTGQWVMTGSASPYTSVLTWLSEATLLSPVPNWALVAGLGFVALKFMQPGGKR